MTDRRIRCVSQPARRSNFEGRADHVTFPARWRRISVSARRAGGRNVAIGSMLLRGASVVAEHGQVDADVLVEDGRITAVEPGIRPSGDLDLIDLQGHVILPGSIDLHVHFEEPGNEQREDFGTGTAAAAAGGITFVVEHPLSEPPTTTAERYRAKRELVGRHAHVDFSLWGGAIPGNLAEMPGMARLGAPGFKA